MTSIKVLLNGSKSCYDVIMFPTRELSLLGKFIKNYYKRSPLLLMDYEMSEEDCINMKVDVRLSSSEVGIFTCEDTDANVIWRDFTSVRLFTQCECYEISTSYLNSYGRALKIWVNKGIIVEVVCPAIETISYEWYEKTEEGLHLIGKSFTEGLKELTAIAGVRPNITKIF